MPAARIPRNGLFVACGGLRKLAGGMQSFGETLAILGIRPRDLDRLHKLRRSQFEIVFLHCRQTERVKLAPGAGGNASLPVLIQRLLVWVNGSLHRVPNSG